MRIIRNSGSSPESATTGRIGIPLGLISLITLVQFQYQLLCVNRPTAGCLASNQAIRVQISVDALAETLNNSIEIALVCVAA